MDVPKGRPRERLHPRGTARLLAHLAAFDRLARSDERPARLKLEAVLDRRLAAHLLHVLVEIEPVRNYRVA